MTRIQQEKYSLLRLFAILLSYIGCALFVLISAAALFVDALTIGVSVLASGVKKSCFTLFDGLITEWYVL